MTSSLRGKPNQCARPNSPCRPISQYRAKQLPGSTPLRNGFTLLELLLAAGIASFVLAALLTSINFMARVEQSSAESIELARLAQSLFDQLERDLGSIVVLAEESDASELLVEADEQLVEAESTEAISVFLGDEVSMAVVIEQVTSLNTQLEEMTEYESAGGEWDGGPGPRRRSIVWTSSPDDEPTEQVARLSSILSSDGLSAIDVGFTAVPEVVSMTFAFLINGEWTDTADDVTDGGLPAAVRVSLSLQSVDGDGERFGDESLSERVFVIPAGRNGIAEESESEL